MAPFTTNPTFRLTHLHSRIDKLTGILQRKLPALVFNELNSRQYTVPIAFFHADNMGPGPGTDPASLSSNVGGEGVLSTGAPRHRVYPTPLNHLSIWAYMALAVVILGVVTVILYMIYTCYHTAGLRARSKTETDVGVGAGAGGVKDGWQNLEDPSGEGEGRLTKDRNVGEKVDGNQDENRIIGRWSEGKGSGLKGLGIRLHGRSKSQYDFPNESQVSIIPGSLHSIYSDRNFSSPSDHDHDQDLESSEGSDGASMSARPLAHTTERSAAYLPFNLPLPLPLPLPPPVTPSPQKQVRQKRTRLRALTQVLSHNLTQSQKSREMYFELQPMIAVKSGIDESQELTDALDESSPSSPSPPSSRSKFAFFAPYPSCNSTSDSTSNLNSNATFRSNSSGNNSSYSPTTFPTTPITPITPMTPVTPMKPKSAGLQFDSNNIQFVETPARISDASPGALSVGGASPPDVQSSALAAISLTRAEMLWNDPKLSPVQGAFGVSLALEKASLVTQVSPSGIVLPSTREAESSKLKMPAIPDWQALRDSSPTSLPDPAPAPTLTTPDQVHRGQAHLRLGYLRRATVSLSESPPSPSPSSCYSDSSTSEPSPSIATARFMLDKDGLKRDNLRNKDITRAGLKKENTKKTLSAIPRPVFFSRPQPSMLPAVQLF